MAVNIVGRLMAGHRRVRGLSARTLAERTGERVRSTTIEAWEQGQRPASHALLSNLLWVAGALEMTEPQQEQLVGAVLAERFLDAVSAIAPTEPRGQVIRLFSPVMSSGMRYWLARSFRNAEIELPGRDDAGTIDIGLRDLLVIRDHLLSASATVLEACTEGLTTPEIWTAARQSWQWLARSLERAVPRALDVVVSDTYQEKFAEQRTAAAALLERAYRLATAAHRHVVRRDVALAVHQGRLAGGSALLADYLLTSPDDPTAPDAVENLHALNLLASDAGDHERTFALLAALLEDHARYGEPLGLTLTFRTAWQLMAGIDPARFPLNGATERLHRLARQFDDGASGYPRRIRDYVGRAVQVRAALWAVPAEPRHWDYP